MGRGGPGLLVGLLLKRLLVRIVCQMLGEDKVPILGKRGGEKPGRGRGGESEEREKERKKERKKQTNKQRERPCNE